MNNTPLNCAKGAPSPPLGVGRNWHSVSQTLNKNTSLTTNLW